MGAFTGQLAVITGAGSGIGRAIAVSLAQAGAALCLVGRHSESLAATAETIRRQAEPLAQSLPLCVPADLSADSDIRQLIEALRSRSPVDMLIHNAGAHTMGRLEAAPVADLDYLYRVNVRAPYLLTQAWLPGLRERQGQIVFINSSAGVHARAGVGPYAATKHALKALADSLREEVNAAGVRVISVYPGRTASPMQAAVHALEGRPYRPEVLMQPEDVAAAVLNALCLPRTAEVTDIHMRPLTKVP